MDIEINQDFNEQEEEQPKTDIMPYVKNALYIIVTIGVLYLAYYYFYASLVNVTINVELSNKQSAQITSINILNQSGNLKATVSPGETIRLRKDKYTLQIDELPNGFYLSSDVGKEGNNTIDISEQDGDYSKTLILYPDWEANFSDNLVIKSSNTVYIGQKLDLNLQFNYLGNNQDIVIYGKGDLNEIYVQYNAKKGLNTININSKFISSDYKSRIQKPLKGKLCIEQTNYCTSDTNIRISDVPNLKIGSIGEIKTNSGNEFSFEIKFDNTTKGSITLDNLTADISYVSSSENEDLNLDSFKLWFNQMPTFTIPSNQRQTLQIRGKVPLGIEKSIVSFKMIIKNPILSTEIGPISLNIDNAKFSVTGPQDKISAIAGSKNPINITMKNDTMFEITNISAKVGDRIISSKLSVDNVKNIIKINSVSDSIPIGGTGSVVVSIEPPLDSLSDKIQADIEISSTAGTSKFAIDADIKEISFKPSVTIKQNFTISNKESDNDILLIKNEGDVDYNVSSISVQAASQSDNLCTSPSLIKIGGITPNMVIPKNDSKELSFQVSSSGATFGAPPKIACILVLKYISPLTLSEVSLTKPFYVSITNNTSQ